MKKIYVEIVEKELSESAHDLSHTYRVHNIAMELAKQFEDVNLKVLEAASMLHDIGRERKGNHALIGAEMAMEILMGLDFSEKERVMVYDSIRAHRFRDRIEPKYLEGKILFDADKIDALGAVGVGRAFLVSGEKKQPLYMEYDEGLEKGLHSPNMEYEYKLKKLPEICYTEAGRSLANERLSFMEVFFEQLKTEVTLVG